MYRDRTVYSSCPHLTIQATTYYDIIRYVHVTSLAWLLHNTARNRSVIDDEPVPETNSRCGRHVH